MRNVFGKSMMVLGLVVGLANASSFAMAPKKASDGQDAPADAVSALGCNLRSEPNLKFSECTISARTIGATYEYSVGYDEGADVVQVHGIGKSETIVLCSALDTSQSRRAYNLVLPQYLQSLGICEKVTSKL